MKSKMTKIFAIISTMLIVSCSSDDEENPRSISNNKYINTSIGVSLQFPTTWTLKVDQMHGKTLMELVAVGTPVDGYSPNISVVIESHSGSSNLNEVLPAFKAVLLSSAPDLADYSESIKEFNGKQYGDISYTASNGGTKYKLGQLLIINKDKDITVTLIDVATRFDANTEFMGIKSSLEIQ
jgi:hypothetical protein